MSALGFGCAKTPRQKHIELSRPRRSGDAGHFSEFDYACIAAISAEFYFSVTASIRARFTHQIVIVRRLPGFF
jgi:hypothetical protein